MVYLDLARMVDLSGPVEEGMWSYPSPVPKVHIKRATSIEDVGYEIHSVSCSSISGTYLEASAHLLPGGRTVDTLSPEEFILKAFVARIPKTSGQKIELRDICKVAKNRKPGEGLLIATGWERHWGGVILLVVVHFSLKMR